MSGGVYSITNTVNGKKYIGSAMNIRRRWLEHLSRLRRGCHENQKLQRAWIKYSESIFAFSVIETINGKTDYGSARMLSAQTAIRSRRP